MSELNTQEEGSEIPWHAEGLAHRLSKLEANREVSEERHKIIDTRLFALEDYSKQNTARMESMYEMHSETMATLAKMQTTLEQLNEVLTAFNKWKNTKSGLKDIGDGLMWIAKVVTVIGLLWTAFHFVQPQVPQISQRLIPTSTLTAENKK